MDDRDLEQGITARFVMLAKMHIGPGRRWTYKIDFCKDMGIVFQEFYMFENKTRNIKFRHLVKFYELTGTDLNFMILGKNINPNNKELIKILQDAIKLLK